MRSRSPLLLNFLLGCLCCWALTLLPASPVAARDRPPASQRELDQMLAPIALYPDALLAQITMAATYPREVLAARRWSLANPRLRGGQAVRAVERVDWDPSVKSLLAFPRILAMMSERLDWTERLGDAYLGQQQEMMDTVQDLRRRAYRAGNLQSNREARIDARGNSLEIELADPGIAYEPWYDPLAIYGTWWWPGFPPMVWTPWPDPRARPGFSAGFVWGTGISLGAEFFFGNFDWRARQINIVNLNHYYYPRATRAAPIAAGVWQHDPAHRGGTLYREAKSREKFSAAQAPRQVRDEFRGRLPDRSPSRAAAIGDHDGAPPAGATADTQRQDRMGEMRGGAASTLPAAHALESVDQGAEVRNASARGHASGAAPPPIERPARAATTARTEPASAANRSERMRESGAKRHDDQ